MLSNAVARLSVSRFVLQIFAIKSRSRRKTEQMLKVFGPNFFRRDNPKFATVDYYRDLPRLRQFVRATYYPLLGKVWLFRLLISVCEA